MSIVEFESDPMQEYGSVPPRTIWLSKRSIDLAWVAMASPYEQHQVPKLIGNIGVDVPNGGAA